MSDFGVMMLRCQTILSSKFHCLVSTFGALFSFQLRMGRKFDEHTSGN